MGGKVSTIVSKCKSKRDQSNLQKNNIKILEDNIDSQTNNEMFFKYSHPNTFKEIKGKLFILYLIFLSVLLVSFLN